MLSRRQLYLIVLALILAIFGLLSHSESFEVRSGWSASSFQFLVLPLVLLLLYSLRIGSRKVPSQVYFISLAGIAFAGVSSFGPQIGNQRVVVINKFSNDRHLARTSRFRDGLLAVLGSHAGVHVEASDKGIRTSADSLKIGQTLAQDPRFDSVLWGDDRWLSMVFSRIPNLFLKSQSPAGILKRSGLQVVQHVPHIGVSFASDNGNLIFISDIISARQALARNREREAETHLLDAASSWSVSTTRAHRAYPLWLLGTLAIERAQSQGSLDVGEIDCAITLFSAAETMLGRGDISLLTPAVYNNQGIAQFLKWQATGSASARDLAEAEFKAAGNIVPYNWSEYGADSGWVISRENLQALISQGNPRAK